MQAEIPRLLFAGTQSGCGKTTVTSAFLQAMVNRGLIPAAFKCGPDYIDPMFHTAVIGAPSRNLDLYFCNPDTVRTLLATNAKHAPIAVMEGVMGFYDGIGGTTMHASSCELALQTETPSILVLSVKGMSLSAAATVFGYLHFAKNTIAGVVLNGISRGMYPYYQKIIEEQTHVHVYGYLPFEETAQVGSRHLGLITAAEIKDLKARMDQLAILAEECLDMDGLIALGKSAPPLTYTPLTVKPVCDPPVRIAIARDRAFCFYYQDNLELLRAYGAELVEFSPLEDTQLPKGVSGLYIGGGYPELYAKDLSINSPMRRALHSAICSGIPTIAECGGFMLLHEQLENLEGVRYPMAGIIPGVARMSKQLQNFGYIELHAKQNTLLCQKDETIRAHEFHYAVSDNAGQSCIAIKPTGRKSWPCVHASGSLFAGYPHLHFYANPAFAGAFVRRADDYRREANRI